jgi:hypothetical protein
LSREPTLRDRVQQLEGAWVPCESLQRIVEELDYQI